MSNIAIGMACLAVLIFALYRALPKRRQPRAVGVGVIVIPTVSSLQLFKGYLLNITWTSGCYVIAVVAAHFVVPSAMSSSSTGLAPSAIGAALWVGPIIGMAVIALLNPYFPRGYLEQPGRKRNGGDFVFACVFYFWNIALFAVAWPLLLAILKADFVR